MNPVQHTLIWLVRLYRWTLSPAKAFLCGPLARCRFTPSCSQYALEAVQMHGALAGTRLAALRVCRCHPWGKCGDDPVPGNRHSFVVPPSAGPDRVNAELQTRAPFAAGTQLNSR